MMFTARMKYLIAVVRDKHTDGVTRELLSLGLLHFVKVSEFNASLETKLAHFVPAQPSGPLSEFRKRVETFLNIVDCHPEEGKTIDLEKFRAIDLGATENTLDDIATEIQLIRDRQKAIQQAILRFQEIKRQVLLLGDLRANIRASSQYTFLNIHTGNVTTPKFQDFYNELATFPSVVLVLAKGEEKTDVLVITMKRNHAEIKALYNKYGFSEVQITQEMIGAGEEVTSTVEKKILILTAEQRLLRDEAQETIKREQATLLVLWENLKLNEYYYKIQANFSRTARTVLFSGWVPAAKKPLIEESISRITGGHHYVEWKDPIGIERETHKKVSVPVQLKNLKLFSPFEMLVRMYSIPEYRTIDPTPVVALLYLVMFGIMFADVGQGLVLIIMSLCGFLFFGSRIKGKLRELFKLLSYCGFSAVIGGLLFGSYFGFQFFKPLWFDFHGLIVGHVSPSSPVQSIFDVLALTLYFGIGIIILGLLFNWINLIRTRHWAKLFFDKTGFAGSLMYFGGIYTAYYFITHDSKSLPDTLTLLLILGLPALFLMGKPIAEWIEKRRHNPKIRFTVFTPLVIFFEWLLELLEFFSGYLSNTLSFMRVAGLGIAHVALMWSFSQIANMVGTAGGYSVFSYVLLVIGNVLVIGLEGLAAGIQPLRLNYYEFFSKYFRGSGEAYAPVSLKSS